MNQILYTGDEAIREPVNKQKKKVSIKGISAFYAISIIILGICIAVGSWYAKEKINETVEASIQPELQIERDDENNTLEIVASHIRGLTRLTYQWNDEEEIIIDGKNQKTINATIDLIGGENTLKISVTEENGQTKTIEKKFIVGNIPEIILEAESKGVNLVATSEVKISYIEYSWDDGEIQKIEVGESEYEGIINAPKGEHLLNIEVVDENKMIAKKEQKVIGATEPVVNVQSKLVNGQPTFVIDVEDEENIKTLEIIHNGGEKQIIDVNQKTYHYEVIMTQGEMNTIIVTAINEHDLSKTRRIKFDNK